MSNVIELKNPEPQHDPERPRWGAVITYRSDAVTPVRVGLPFEEFEELAAFIEKGPDWRAIEKIEISLNRTDDPALTIEEAANF